MATLVDCQSGRQMSIVYGNQDREIVLKYWEDTDGLLDKMQATASFRGRTRWCDLMPVHYKLLLTQSVENTFEAIMMAAERGEKFDADDEPVINSMNFIIMAYVKAYEDVADCTIENIRITRIAENEIIVNVLSFVDANFQALQKYAASAKTPTSPSLKLVTREDED